MTITDPRRVPHTGPGHASGDPGWCEGCAAEMAADKATREALGRDRGWTDEKKPTP